MFVKLTPRSPLQIVPAGTETDPTGFSDEMVVAGTTGTVTKTGIEGAYTFWYAVSLVADTEYTFGQAGTGDYWEAEASAMYLYDSTPAIVVQTIFDWDLWTGGDSMTYTPTVSGVYLLKVMGSGSSVSVATAITPVPAVYALEQTVNRTSIGFDRLGRFITYGSSIDAGLIDTYNDNNTILFLDGVIADTAKGNETPRTIYGEGAVTASDGNIVFGGGYLTLPSNEITNALLPTTEWTIDIRLKPSTNVGGLSGLIGYDANANTFPIYYTKDDRVNLYGSTEIASNTGSVPLETWHLISFEYHNDGGVYKMRVYVDGVKQTTTTYTLPGDGINVGLDWYVGRSSDGAHRAWHGSISMLRISNIARYKGQNFTA